MPYHNSYFKSHLRIWYSCISKLVWMSTRRRLHSNNLVHCIPNQNMATMSWMEILLSQLKLPSIPLNQLRPLPSQNEKYQSDRGTQLVALPIFHQIQITSERYHRIKSIFANYHYSQKKQINLIHPQNGIIYMLKPHVKYFWSFSSSK